MKPMDTLYIIVPAVRLNDHNLRDQINHFHPPNAEAMEFPLSLLNEQVRDQAAKHNQHNLQNKRHHQEIICFVANSM